MLNNISIILFLMAFQISHAIGAEKDATYSACLDVITNEFDNASIENRSYLMGKENGIEAGVSLAYKKHNIKDPLQTFSWPYILDKACRAVLVDESNLRAMTVFNNKVFILYTNSVGIK